MQTAGATLSPLQREVAFLTRVIAALATGLGVVFFAIGYASGLPLWHTGMFAIGIIVANVPEGLLPTVTLALAMAASAWREERAGQAPRLSRGAGLDYGDLHRQDRDLDREPNDGQPALRGRAASYCPKTRWPAGEVARGLLLTALHCEVEKAREGGVIRLLGDPTEVALIEMARSAARAGAPSRVRRRGPVRLRPQTPLNATPHGRSRAVHQRRTCGLAASLQQLRTTALSEIAARWRDAEEAMASDGLRVFALASRRVPEPYDRTPGRGFDTARPRRARGPVPTRSAGGNRQVPLRRHRRDGHGRPSGDRRGDRPSDRAGRHRRRRVITGDRLQRMSATQLQLVLDAPEVILRAPASTRNAASSPRSPRTTWSRSRGTV